MSTSQVACGIFVEHWLNVIWKIGFILKYCGSGTPHADVFLPFFMSPLYQLDKEEFVIDDLISHVNVIHCSVNSMLFYF